MCLFNSELILVVHTALIICELEITCGLVFAKNVRLCVVCGALHLLGICELILTLPRMFGVGWGHGPCARDSVDVSVEITVKEIPTFAKQANMPCKVYFT